MQVEVRKRTIDNSNKNHPNFNRNYLKEWKCDVKTTNAGFTLKIEDVELAVVSEVDKSIYHDIDETMGKEFFNKQD